MNEAGMRVVGRLLPAVVLMAVAAPGCSSRKQKEEAAIDFRAVIARAKGKVYPAIVFVKPIREEYSAGERKKQEVFGSGAIISPDGLVFTNAHVAEKATEIRCVLEDLSLIHI